MGRDGRKKDPINWRTKVLLLYRTILKLREENKCLRREVDRLKRKIEKSNTWNKRKKKFVEWIRSIFFLGKTR